MGDYSDREAGYVPLVYHTKRLAFAAGLPSTARTSSGSATAQQQQESLSQQLHPRPARRLHCLRAGVTLASATPGGIAAARFARSAPGGGHQPGSRVQIRWRSFIESAMSNPGRCATGQEVNFLHSQLHTDVLKWKM